ncbi:luciferase family oxidoreductase group 1 [Caulobacter ginsengisoli]|uniref:Luciferase family oxidoreductase group 1 n=1 Tax=Caulobacter ginsengisoli TaxID=400775 RepID=A0ABU0IMW8_9CAUL|nr:LLM class flavin-dependent oxidoreductase [Caulobacter ginsengisoli]MDQ0463362.1 luciferase family oxidoreductase group 1 [Caulobacter ginsengisoli]
MTALSVLDLAPVIQGSDAGQALRNSRDLARHVERLGYKRFWLAEHHNMAGVASAATSVAIGFVAEGTSTIRVGAGGIMLPNHAPLVIAEQFGTLAALYGDRIDLGIGRAPGTDQTTAYALRRNLAGDIDHFPRDVVELINYFRPEEPGQKVRAVPGAGLNVPVWILGSSLYGAQLAAMLGLPYAFASHFAPGDLDRALLVYRDRFQPSEFLDKPYVMLGINVFAADTDREARTLFSSLQQAFIALRTGTPGKLRPPIEDFDAQMDPGAAGMLAQSFSTAVVGGRDTVRQGLADFIARTGADELMVTASIFDHAARLRSFEIVAEAHSVLVPA